MTFQDYEKCFIGVFNKEGDFSHDLEHQYFSLYPSITISFSLISETYKTCTTNVIFENPLMKTTHCLLF